MRIPSLIKDDRGITIPLFAILAFGLITLSLGGLDLMRFHIVQSRVQAAMDAAVLAAGRRLDSKDLQTDVNTFFWANVKRGFMHATIHDLKVSEPEGTLFSGQTVTTTLTVEVPLLVAGFIDATAWTFQMKTVAKREATDVELVLAMDNTGSMAGTKLTDMQDAAKTLITSLLGDASETSSRDGLYFGTVPFTTTVRLPEAAGTYAPESWLDVPDTVVVIDRERRYEAWGGSRTTYPAYVADFDADTHWDGCALENDSNATTGLDDARDTLSVQITDELEVCMERAYNWDDREWQCSRRETRPVYNGETCSIQRASFLDADSGVATAAIDNMVAEGGTAVFTGMLWGWRMLSPDWDAKHDWGSVTLPQPHDPTLTKAVVLLTDGANSDNLHLFDTSLGGYSTALGRGPGQDDLDTALKNVCRDAKADGIVVFTITFGSAASSGTIRTLMENCATDKSFFYNAPTTAELKKAFTAIGGSLSRLSLIE